VMSSVTSRFRPRSNRLRKRISRLHKGHSPSISTLNGHLSIFNHPIPIRCRPTPQTQRITAAKSHLTNPEYLPFSRLPFGSFMSGYCREPRLCSE
jgi:hypothetical protein